MNMSSQANNGKVVLDVTLTFPNKDLELDPSRYTGNESRITEALMQKGMADQRGYLTEKGQVYFTEKYDSRDIKQLYCDFSGCCDNYDYMVARREYEKYCMSCPRKVIFSFYLEKGSFHGDPMRYRGAIAPLLVEHGFFSKDWHCASKTIEAVRNAECNIE